MYYWGQGTLIRGIGAYSPDFLSIVQFGVFWSTFSVIFLLRKQGAYAGFLKGGGATLKFL